jgi:hypothetical protein
MENTKMIIGPNSGFHPINGYEMPLLYIKRGKLRGRGDFSICPDLEKKQSKRCVHNGPGIRENAARIDNRYAKKQYRRAFKANATDPVPDYTASVYDRTAPVQDSTRPVHDRKTLVQDSTRPVHDRKALVQDSARPVHDRTAPVQDNTGPVHDRTALVHDNSRPVHDCTAPVQDNTKLVHDRTASVQDITASVSDDAVFVAEILIPMRYCKNNFNTIVKEENGKQQSIK